MAISGQKRTPSYEAIIYDQVKNLILSLLDIGRTKMKTTAERMADYLRVFETRDPRSMAELYSKKSFVIWGDRMWRGQDEIELFYKEIFDRVLPPDTVFNPNMYEIIEEDIAYIVWSGSSSSSQITFGVDTFVVREGEIQSLTVYIESDI
jgi:hypothetical protein